MPTIGGGDDFVWIGGPDEGLWLVINMKAAKALGLTVPQIAEHVRFGTKWTFDPGQPSRSTTLESQFVSRARRRDQNFSGQRLSPNFGRSRLPEIKYRKSCVEQPALTRPVLAKSL